MGQKKPAAPLGEGGLEFGRSKLGKLAELGLDRLEIREVAGAVIDLCILYDTCLIDEESGPLGNSTHDEVLLGKELIISDAVSFGGLVIIIGKELEADALLFGPGRLREWIVTGNSEDFAIQVGVGSESSGDFTKLLGANAGEGHGDKKKKDVLLAGDFGESDNFRTTLAESDEGKIRGLIANFDTHNGWNIDEAGRMQTGKCEKMLEVALGSGPMKNPGRLRRSGFSFKYLVLPAGPRGDCW